MSESKYSAGWSQHPIDRGHRRQQLRETATRLLSTYLSEVGKALRAEGLAVTHVRMSHGPDLEARLRVSPVDATSGLPARVELAWAEDTGWSIEHHLLGGLTGGIPWRYLHLELVPAPKAVARFVVNVFTSTEDVGVSYPAQFRFRGQPLQPVIDALARHNTSSHGAAGGGSAERGPESVARRGAPSWR
jgi:hypothetical protein